VVSNRTIKSWCSFGWIKIRILAYAATSAGIGRVQREKRQDGVRYERLVGEGGSHWSEAQRTEVKRICANYAEKTSRRFIPVGYEKAFTCIVFEHKCPNTNPPILWAGSKSWKPMFEARPKLGFPVWPIATELADQEQRILEAYPFTP
jgi:hypothetical protein